MTVYRHTPSGLHIVNSEQKNRHTLGMPISKTETAILSGFIQTNGLQSLGS